MRNHRNLGKGVLAVTLMCTVAMAVRAERAEAQPVEGTTFTYQGRLANAGAPAEGLYDLEFTLFSSADGIGRPVAGPVEIPSVTVEAGLFTVEIDFGTGVFNGNPRWLEIGVKPIKEERYTILAPRQCLTPVPYAHYASSAPMTAHDHWGESWSGTGTGLDLNSSGGTGLHAVSDIGYGVYGESATPFGAAVHGLATHTSGLSIGVYGKSDSVNGIGVYGYNPNQTGETYGVQGRVYSATGCGVYGYALSATGETCGVRGVSDADAGCGVRGESTADEAMAFAPSYGVKGVHHNSNGSGVYGETDGAGWSMGFVFETVAGVHGHTNATSGRSYGVYGTSANYDGAGVCAYHSGAGPGLRAESMYGNPIEAYDRDSNMGMVSFERVFYVSSAGEVYADGNFHSGGADFAEMLPGQDGLEPGDVLVVDANGKLTRSTAADQASVVGVYSTKPGFVGGDDGNESIEGNVPLAIVGIVPVKVVGENGSIHPGDRLVTSSTPGHAMRAGPSPENGTIVGKALQTLEGDRGLIRMLVMLQ